jgi:lipopolysaccharide export system permease protein
MIRILDRYVAREFVRLFLLFSIAAPMLFIMGDWTDNLDTYAERQIPLERVAIGYLYKLPQFVLFSLPIAALIATVFTVSSMTRHSEMAAAKAGGISFWRATAMLPVLGIVLTGFGLVLSELVPITLSRADVIFGGESGYRGSRSDFVYRAEDGTVYGVRRLDLDANRIYGLTVQREGDGVHTATLNAYASEAAWDSTTGWTLVQGRFRVMLPGTPERSFTFNQLHPVRLYEAPEEMLAEPKEPDEMRYAEMGRFIRALRRSGGEPFGLMHSQAERIAIPVAVLVIVLFGAPLANASARSGPAYGIGISLGVTIVYLMLFRLGEAMGEAGMVHPVLAAWAPNALFLLAAFLLTARVRT